MSFFSQLLASSFLLLIVSLILYVLFGQITVRKLRNNPVTKDALGFQYASGTEIANVVKILAISRRKASKLKHGKMSFLYADVDLIYEHTTGFDRFLAKAVYWSSVLGGSSMVILMIGDLVGFFE